MSKRKISRSVIIVGPTASGKSELAVSIAREKNGEIVNADSMQIYKHMNIGTAKLPAEERAAIPHHMIDVLELEEEYSVSDYKEAALGIMENISKNGAMPIVCGGTGLYINALTSKLDFTAVRGDEELRRSLAAYADTYGNHALHKRLEKVDSELAERLHPNDVKRVIRGIEVFELTGNTLSGQGSCFHLVPDEEYDYVMIGLEWPREMLYERINQRVNKMMQDGLYQEARAIFSKGIDLSHQSMMALGYRQMYEHFTGKYSLEKAVENIKRETRRYAKRQLTWFKKDLRINWLMAGESSFREVEKSALALI